MLPSSWRGAHLRQGFGRRLSAEARRAKAETMRPVWVRPSFETLASLAPQDEGLSAWLAPSQHTQVSCPAAPPTCLREAEAASLRRRQGAARVRRGDIEFVALAARLQLASASWAMTPRVWLAAATTAAPFPSPRFCGERVARTGRSEPGEGHCTAPHPLASRATSRRAAGRGKQRKPRRRRPFACSPGHL